jgi:glycosyltransferase involved in cell wall biosynthesis
VKPNTADITLVLEGTYPFLSGGLAQWVHQIVGGLPQYRFYLVCIGSTPDACDRLRFTLPENVVGLQSVYLWAPEETCQPRPGAGSKDLFRDIGDLHGWFGAPCQPLNREAARRLCLVLAEADRGALDEVLFSRGAWDYLCGQYRAKADAADAFDSFYWTVRVMHAPLLKLARAARRVPPARAIHAVSNGYAGFLGSVLRHLTGRPFILTEHGIYAKERKIDLQGLYMAHGPDLFQSPPATGMNTHAALWVRHFEGLSRLVYAEADPILSCHEGNRRRQVRETADPQRTRVIPNGIDVTDYRPLRAARAPGLPPVLGLIGRLVPIKDIKTFIRAVRLLISRMPEAEAWLIGPEEEDPQYAEECRQLAATLGLERNLKFLGFQDLRGILPQLGLVVLTSISEAFPLVILEAFAAGIPVLATEVGACRELIEGNRAEDRALGPAGAVVPIANPEATAAAAYALLSDPGRWFAAQRAAIDRVERYYTERQLLEAYDGVYRTAVEA